MFWFAAVVGSFIVLIFGLIKYLKANNGFWTKHGIPVIITGEIVSFWDRIRLRYPFQDLDKMFYDKFKTQYPGIKAGGMMEFRTPVLFVMDTDLIRSITVKDFEYFMNRRKFPVKKDDTSHLGQSVLFLENQEWKDMRSTLSPTFSTGKIKRMFEIFNDSARQMTDFLNQSIKRTGSNEIELRDVCGRYTMNVISSSAFGIESNAFNETDSLFYTMGLRFQNQFKGVKVIRFLLALLAPKLFKLLKMDFMDPVAIGFMSEVITKAVKHREASGEKRQDFIQLLLETRSETNMNNVADESVLDTFEKDALLKNTKTSKVYMTDDLILAQSILFFFAGFDTTETLLIFAAYELALNPEIQEKLALELKEAAEANDGKLSYETVTTLEYLDMVVSEALRKYPPGIRLERRCTKDYKVPELDYVIKKDDIVVIPTYAIHYDETIYPDPQKFDPTRFNAVNKAGRSPYAYMPFGAGPRNCIAMRFALTEGKTALAELVKSFVIEPTARTDVPMQYVKNTALKPLNGMWLKLTPRT